MSDRTTLAEHTAPKPEKLIVQDNSAISYLMDTARFEHCYRIARLMASASLIPDHLKTVGSANNKKQLEHEQITANCFMIVNQALRWGFDPFAVAPETYVVGGKLAFQGKLVAAAINALAGLDGRLDYTFAGKGDDLTVTVTGRFKGETKDRSVTVSVGDAKTDNQMWRKDPEQKLVYSGSIKWARRHCPEVVMGIILDDEADEMRNVTPLAAPVTAPAGNPFATPGRAKTGNAEPVAEVEAVEEAEPIADVKKRIRDALKASGLKLAEATALLVDKGLLPEGTPLAKASDPQFRLIADQLHVWDKQEAASTKKATAAVYVDFVNTEASPAVLGCKSGGACFELRTSAPDLVELMETLNPDEEIRVAGADGILTKLELVEGGAQ